MHSVDTIPVAVPGVIASIVETGTQGQVEVVLVLPSQGKLKVINDVGARIWSLVDGKRNVRGIAAQICLEYDVSPDQAEADTMKFIDSLVEKGILILTEPPAV